MNVSFSAFNFAYLQLHRQIMFMLRTFLHVAVLFEVIVQRATAGN
jgi:hypothetical protein